MRSIAGAKATAPGDVRQRRPNLPSIEAVVIALVLGAGLQARQIAAGVRFAEALAPDLLCGEQGRQAALLLVFGPVGDNERPAHAQPDHVDGFGRLGDDHLVVEDELLHEALAAAAELLGPGDADIARVVQLLLPPAPALDKTLLAFFFGAVVSRLVCLEPGSDLVAQLLLRLAQLEVHSTNLTGNPP